MKKLNVVDDSGFIFGYIENEIFYERMFGRDFPLNIENGEIKQWISRNGKAPELETLATIEGKTIRNRYGAIFSLVDSQE